MADMHPKNSGRGRLLQLTVRMCGVAAILLGGFLLIRYIDRVDLQQDIQASVRIYLRNHLDQAERNHTLRNLEYPRIIVDQLTHKQDEAHVTARMVTSQQEVTVRLLLNKRDHVGNWDVVEVLNVAYSRDDVAEDKKLTDVQNPATDSHSIDRQIRTALEHRPGIEIRTIR